MRIKNIIILAGGDSTRFWPLEDKCFIDFLGKPLIFHILNSIKEYTENLWVVANEKNKKKFFFFKEIFSPKINLITQKDLSLGMAGALLSCEKKIKGEVLILNGSDIFNFKILADYIKKIRLNKLKLLFLGKQMKEYFPGGYFIFNKKKEIIRVLEKPDKNNLPSNYVKLVCDYFFDFNFLISQIKKIEEKTDDVYERSLNLITSEYFKGDLFLYEGYWFFLKYPWHTLLLTDYFLNQVLKDKIIIGKNVKINQTAKIVPPCYIGDNTIIGDFALVIKSHINKDCLIGGYSEVTRSYIGKKVFLHRNYVGDSVLDDEVLLGAGCVLANLRFDEREIKSQIKEQKINTNFKKLGAIVGKRSKLGVNSTILPGIKIGKCSIIGPGEIVTKDILDGKFIFKEERKNNLVI